jgi:hypothetical protein
MFASRHRNTHIAEYSMIVEPRAEGALIGYFAGEPISEGVVDTFGRHFSYVGLACRGRDGRIDVTQLKVGEFVAGPGLIYRLVTSNSGAAAPGRRAA